MNSAASQQLYGIPQTPIIQVQTVQSQLVDTLKKCKTRMVKLGKAEVVVGLIIFMLDLIFLMFSRLDDKHQGMWCGPFLIASGITCVVTRSTPLHRMFIANMITSLLAALFMVVLVSYSCIYISNYAYINQIYEGYFVAEVAMESIIAGLGFVALIITVLHFGYSCVGACNPSGSTQTSVQMNNDPVILAVNQAAVNCGSGLNTGLTQPNESAVAQLGDIPPPYSPDQGM